MSSAPQAVRPAINGWNAEYLDAQYARWRQDPTSVSEDMRQFFAGFDLAMQAAGGTPVVREDLVGGTRASEDRAQAAVSSLIQHYREIGHLCAAIDPFGRERECPEALTPQYHGLDEADLDRTFNADTLAPDGTPMPLRDIISRLDETYCRSIGVEFGHMSSEQERLWLEGRMEGSRNHLEVSRAGRFHILYTLYRAELFERFCGKRYLGVKRFSLEGGESLIPMLDRIVESAGSDYGVRELVLGMSHRGRLNVLTNVVGKTYEQIFTEFDDAWNEEDALMGGGDVKYHRGFSSNRKLQSGKHIWLAMASNPSHLESAGAVVMGRCRAKQRMRGDKARQKVISLIIHGDAAIAGQGVVAEDFNLSQLQGYTVGGTIHVVINNLIGFTTGEEDARSTRYCTDVAKMIEAPIFHVNGEDPEAVVHVAQLALDYRMTFQKDVVIDLLCYRKHGHNETDEAAFTQPILYDLIKKKPTVLEVYADRLRRDGDISEADIEKIHSNLEEDLDRAYLAVKKTPVDPTPDPGARRWEGYSNKYTFEPVSTGVDLETLREISHAMGRWPEGFTPHRKLVKILEERGRIVDEDLPVDWAGGESLAVGSLLLDGAIVRFSGQDVRRGTFSHRHAVLRDMKTNETYCPLNHIRELGDPGTERDVGTIDEQGRPRQAKYCIYDSPLSEYSVLGFEYGFSLASPNMLVIWEAQFG
ncbi:MAG: 2-oxoglutarate dehydrogenase E1 component, partial [Phycisphaerales bacterium]|nr:2-oxoglutarate dehydrogenase E1 component [Phycisphaerales bacterium]